MLLRFSGDRFGQRTKTRTMPSSTAAMVRSSTVCREPMAASRSCCDDVSRLIFTGGGGDMFPVRLFFF